MAKKLIKDVGLWDQKRLQVAYMDEPIALTWALGIRRATQPCPIAAAGLLRGRVSGGLRRADQVSIERS